MAHSPLASKSALLALLASALLAPLASQAAPASSQERERRLAAESAADNWEKRSKIGVEIRGIKSPAALGLLLGFKFVNFESETFFIGGAGYTGQLSSSFGSFSYGGLVAGYNFPLLRKMNLELSMLAGGGGGFTGVANTTAGGATLNPELAFDFQSGKHVRTALNVGYVYMPSASTFSGVSGGIRFDFML